MPQSFTSYKDEDKVARKMMPRSTFSGSLAWLHKVAWGRNDPSLCFRRLEVQRETPRANAEVPERPFVLGWKEVSKSSNFTASEGPELLSSLFGVSSSLVRQEYVDILREMMDCCMRDLPDRTTVMDVDDHEVIKNPFTGQQGTPKTTGAIVIGSPGVGKSVFLVYLLALRVLAGQTTIFQSTNTKFYVLNPEGVFKVSSPVEEEQLRDYLEPGTWLLFDSNRSLKEPPEHFTYLRNTFDCFMVQSASPRNDRIEWAKKVGKVPLFWMAPWSLGELIAARDIQIWIKTEKPTELQIESFSEIYGTSARTVFSFAVSPGMYEATVDAGIRSLTRENILTLLRDASAASTDESFSHLSVIATPNPRNHMEFYIDIISKAMTERMLARLAEQDKEAALHLYWLFLTSSCTRASAGYLLEKAFVEQFPKGGKWPVTQMKMSRTKVNIHWKLDASASTQYLLLGYKDEPAKVIARASFPSSIGGEFSLDYYEFPPGAQVQLKNGFFRPKAKNQVLFDSFVYDASSQVATLFQVTVTNSHSLVASGLERLRDAKAVDIVVVTCPRQYEGAEDVYIRKPNDDEVDKKKDIEKLRNVYLLELEE